MENNILNDEVLTSVAGAGVTPPESKYNIGESVRFRSNGDDKCFGTIISLYYKASQKSWEYIIETGAILPYYVLEKDILSTIGLTNE